jgi:hypothetical protein
MVYGFSEIAFNTICGFTLGGLDFKYCIVNITIRHTAIYATGNKTDIISGISERFRRDIFVWFWFGFTLARNYTLNSKGFRIILHIALLHHGMMMGVEFCYLGIYYFFTICFYLPRMDDTKSSQNTAETETSRTIFIVFWSNAIKVEA